MHPATLFIIACLGLLLGILSLIYIRRFQNTVLKHAQELEKRERELKRRVLELQILRSLGERVGYSLDLRQILEVIIGSLSDLVEFETVSYMLLGDEGRIIFNIKVAQPVSRQFLTDMKTQMLSALSAMTGQNLQSALVDETVSGSRVDEGQNSASAQSFFNLPLSLGSRVVALINVSSIKRGLYGDDETAILYTILTQVSVQAGKLSAVVENEKRKLSAMIGSFVDGVVMVDKQFNLLVVNPALLQMLKTNSDHRISLYHIIAAVGAKADLEGALRQVMERQILITLPEFSLYGRVVQVEVEPVKDQFGYLLGAAVVFRDITTQKQLENLREEFTAMMVHELRTPLTVISYSTDMMMTDLTKLSKSDLGQNLNIIQSTTKNMLSLVGELLDVAKIEAGKFAVVKKEDNLKSLIEEKFVSFKPLADQKSLRFSHEIDLDLPAVSFDRIRLGQVIDNLLSNALKYTSSGRVSIKAGYNSSQVIVSVQDTGDGIASEDIHKLFSKFDQLGKGKSGEIAGTGLGLVISKGIIEAHGGKIWAASEGLGKGSTFTFSIPIS